MLKLKPNTAEKENILTLPPYFGGMMLVLFTLFIYLCDINDPLFLFGTILGLFLIWNFKKNKIDLNYCDIIIILVWIYNLFSILFSCEIVSSFIHFKTLTVTIFYYFIIRFYFNDIQRIKYLLLGICFIIGILGLISLGSFLYFKNGIEHLGFSELYNFRFRYKPVGYLTNVWGNLLIIFLGIIIETILLFKTNKKIILLLYGLFLLILFGIIVSFSRGIYISFTFLLLLTFIFLIQKKIKWTKKVLISLMIILPILLYGYLLRDEVFRTVQFNKTVSQQRSIEGRYEAIAASYEIFQESPLFGIGSGNYSLGINNYKFEDDNANYTNFAPNVYSQLIIEQGIIGSIIWLSLFITFIILIFKIQKHPKLFETGIISLGILIAVCIREASFSTFFEFSGYQLLIFTIIGITLNIINYKFNINIKNTSLYLRFILPSFIVMICSTIIISSIIFSQNRYYNELAIKSLKVNKLEEAEKYISKTNNAIPYLINKSIIFLDIYNRTKDNHYLKQAQIYIEKAIRKNKYDSMLQYYHAIILKKQGLMSEALQIFLDLSKKFPNKSIYNFETFNILYELEKKVESVPYLAQSIYLSPKFIESEFWKELKLKDRTITKSIIDHLQYKMKEIPYNKLSPIEQSKYANLLLYFGQRIEAKQIFEKVITSMPNLAYPWYYLLVIDNEKDKSSLNRNLLERFLFLNYNIQSPEIVNKLIKTGEIKEMLTRKPSLNNDYKTKFASWYKCPLMEYN